jgi:hypothetical protein
MVMSFRIFIFLVALSGVALAQENNRGGIVYGAKAAFNIAAPDGALKLLTFVVCQPSGEALCRNHRSGAARHRK